MVKIMTKEQEALVTAKESLREHIKFVNSTLDHLEHPEVEHRNKALIVALALRRFMTNDLDKSIESIIEEITKDTIQ